MSYTVTTLKPAKGLKDDLQVVSRVTVDTLSEARKLAGSFVGSIGDVIRAGTLSGHGGAVELPDGTVITMSQEFDK